MSAEIPEQLQTTTPERVLTNGERWLEMIGYGHLIDEPSGYADENDNELRVGEFDKLCGEHIAAFFTKLEQTPLDDPDRDTAIKGARNMVAKYFDLEDTTPEASS